MAQFLAPVLAVSAPLVSPVVLLILCVAAGVGTVMLLPSTRQTPIRTIGGTVLIAAGLILAALLVRQTAGEAKPGVGPYFWIFSAIAIVSAVRVITHPRPVYSALYFVLAVFASAGLFVLLAAEFMAAALVLIYAGAILITYVFVIMLAAEATPTSGPLAGMAEYDVMSREPFVASAVGFALMGVLLFVIFDRAQPVDRSIAQSPPAVQLAVASDEVAVVGAPGASPLAHFGSTQRLGDYLFKNQLVNLELAGLILTLAMIGAIVIARRRVRGPLPEPGADVVSTPATVTDIDDNPHSIPVYGTENPRQKEYPET